MFNDFENPKFASHCQIASSLWGPLCGKILKFNELQLFSIYVKRGISRQAWYICFNTPRNPVKRGIIVFSPKFGQLPISLTAKPIIKGVSTSKENFLLFDHHYGGRGQYE